MKIGVIQSVLSEATVADHCNICNKVTEQKVQVLQEVFVLALPLFPAGKKGKAVCTKCNHETPVFQMPTYARHKYDALRPLVKTPVWTFALSVIIGLVLLVMVVKSPFDQKRMNAQIDKPQIGDVYEVTFKDESRIFNKDRYTIWKVVSFTGDSIHFVKSVFNGGKPSQIDDIRNKPEDEKWGDDTISKSRKDLKEETTIFASQEEIKDIGRK